MPANAPVTDEPLVDARGAGQRAATFSPTWLGFFQEVSRRASAVGDIIATAEQIEKRDGCLRCNGGTHRAAEYPDLAEALGGAGPDGTFQVPDISPPFAGRYWIRAR